jgi:hypothetical protein
MNYVALSAMNLQPNIHITGGVESVRNVAIGCGYTSSFIYDKVRPGRILSYIKVGIEVMTHKTYRVGGLLL